MDFKSWFDTTMKEVLPDNVTFLSVYAYERNQIYPNAPIVHFDYNKDDLRLHKAWLLKQSIIETRRLSNKRINDENPKKG
jgi:hypothetical protein